jgi:hypothetical protein
VKYTAVVSPLSFLDEAELQWTMHGEEIRFRLGATGFELGSEKRSFTGALSGQKCLGCLS